MTVRFPIAPDAGAALKAPLGRAVREREAAALAGAQVEFVRELAGPAFAAREAAEAAYAGLLDAPGRPVQPEDRWCELMEVIDRPAGRRPPPGGQAEPSFEGGRRWPAPPAPLRTVWRLSVGYWRPVVPGRKASADLPQARAARRSGEAQALDAGALRAMAGQALRPIKPQQPLDIGLFEVPLPESPDQTIPDE